MLVQQQQQMNVGNMNSSAVVLRPSTNPTRECLPLVIQLMPYYAQSSELAILRELHAKLGDPAKQLHQRLLIDAIVREQWAISRLLQQQNNGIGRAMDQQSSQQQQLGNNPLRIANINNINFSGISWPGSAAASHQQSSSHQRQSEEMVAAPRAIVRMEVTDSRLINHTVKEEEDVIIVDDEMMAIDGGGNLNSRRSQQQQSQADAMALTAFGGRAATNIKEQQAPNPNDPLAERRANFLREASTLYNNKYRMLSRSVYEFYIKRLKITQNLDPRLLLKKDLEIRNKFELSLFVEDGIAVERLVERGKERRKLVAIEEVFDVVNKYHDRIGHGKRMAIYDAIKREYANITLNCVLLYMAGCQGCYSTGTDPAQQVDNRRSNQFNDDMQQLKSRCSPLERTVERRAAKLGLDEIDYSEHFLIGEDEIRCRHCHFVYFHKSRQRPRHSLRSHLRNYHRKLFNQMMEQQNGMDRSDAQTPSDGGGQMVGSLLAS